MTSYDLTRLNPREFETLSADILSEIEQCRVERFKEGRDGGIDGRFFSTEKEEVIIQCKHYTKSGISNLVRHLEKRELVKIQKLNPKRYILTTSIDLSPEDKKKIQDVLSPYIKSSADILGKQDITAFLSTHSNIERAHYKLWITSSNVILTLFNNALIGRSEFKLEQIKSSLSKYVLTSNHKKAIDKLDEKGCLIITGSPGIGKTTLADQILLEYASKGFEVCYLENPINEAEEVFIKGKPQIFYFDDFLGSNILDSFNKKGDSHIVSFLQRVSKDRSKRFILTSRTIILNNAKSLSEKFQIANIDENEYEIQLSSLTTMDKAHILYNHIWHSPLSEEHIDEIYRDKRYKKIIEHRNYNPRLVSFVTDPKRLSRIEPNTYWRYVQNSLDNPADIWNNFFTTEINALCKISVYLVALNGSDISESDLKKSFVSMALEDDLSRTSTVETDFEITMRVVSGSVLNRKINLTNSAVKYSLFDPSIGDYILNKANKEPLFLNRCFNHLDTIESLKNLGNLKIFNRELVKKTVFSEVVESLVVTKLNSESTPIIYKIKLANLATEIWEKSEVLIESLKNFLPIFSQVEISTIVTEVEISDICGIHTWYINTDTVNIHYEILIKLLRYFLTRSLAHEEYGVILELVSELESKVNYHTDYDWKDLGVFERHRGKVNEIGNIKAELRELFFGYWKNIIHEKVASDIDDLDYDKAYERITNFVEDKLLDFKFEFNDRSPNNWTINTF
jgi:hypothetical protein